MSAPEGNEFWRRRKRHGRNRRYDDPETLWDDCFEYFEWNEVNPIQALKIVKRDGKAIETTVSKKRPLSIGAMCINLGIRKQTWYYWRKHRQDLSYVVETVEMIIYEDQFTGAVLGIYHPRIIMAKLVKESRKRQREELAGQRLQRVRAVD